MKRVKATADNSCTRENPLFTNSLQMKKRRKVFELSTQSNAPYNSLDDKMKIHLSIKTEKHSQVYPVLTMLNLTLLFLNKSSKSSKRFASLMCFTYQHLLNSCFLTESSSSLLFSCAMIPSMIWHRYQRQIQHQIHRTQDQYRLGRLQLNKLERQIYIL